MRIRRRISQHRRDFQAVYECESCGHEFEGHGYDDEYYLDTVVPAMMCPECRQSGEEPGL